VSRFPLTTGYERGKRNRHWCLILVLRTDMAGRHGADFDVVLGHSGLLWRWREHRQIRFAPSRLISSGCSIEHSELLLKNNHPRELINPDGEVLRIRPVVMISPTWRASCRCLTQQTYQGGTRGSRLCGGGLWSGDRELEGMRKGHGTQDLYRFRPPRWRTLCPVWGIKYGALRFVLGWDQVPG
jgi:hypothetical protein